MYFISGLLDYNRSADLLSEWMSECMCLKARGRARERAREIDSDLRRDFVFIKINTVKNICFTYIIDLSMKWRTITISNQKSCLATIYATCNIRRLNSATEKSICLIPPDDDNYANSYDVQMIGYFLDSLWNPHIFKFLHCHL